MKPVSSIPDDHFEYAHASLDGNIYCLFNLGNGKINFCNMTYWIYQRKNALLNSFFTHF